MAYLDIRVRAALEQRGGLTDAFARVDIGSGGQKRPDHVGKPAVSREVQRGAVEVGITGAAEIRPVASTS